MTTREFRLPDPGEGLVEAEIVTWRVAVGDPVEINDIVVEVETSKSLVELPIPFAGTVAELLVNEGDVVDVGSPIIRVTETAGTDTAGTDTAGTDTADTGAADTGAADTGTATSIREEAGAPEPAGETAGSPATPPDPGRVPILVGYGPRTTDAKRRPRRAGGRLDGGEGQPAVREQVADTFSTGSPVSRRADERAPLPPDQDEQVGQPLPRSGTPAPASTPARPGPGAVLAKPPVRKLAKDLGVDLATVIGSGPGGTITRSDTEAAAAAQVGDGAPALPAPTAPRSDASDLRVPIRGVRKATAAAMVSSAFTAPHVTEWLSCDVTAAMELLDRLRARRDFADVRLSPLVLVAKAVCLALGRAPELNSHWDEAAQEIVLKRTINLGIAAATPRGLLVPNIKDAARLSLSELAAEITTLTATARDGRVQPVDTAAGTFTITNVGVFGIDAGTPILNPGEAGILCLGSISRRPWVVGSGAGERIEPRWVTTLALSFDHRLVDGEQGSRFLFDVAAVLTDPALALVY